MSKQLSLILEQAGGFLLLFLLVSYSITILGYMVYKRPCDLQELNYPLLTFAENVKLPGLCTL